VFSGGVGTGARRHGAPRDEAPEPDLGRQAAELALMHAAVDTGLPVLAIGRGMYLLNVAWGGSVTESAPGPAAHGSNGAVASPAAREVRIRPDSRLGRLLGPSVKVPAEPEPAGRQPVLDRLGHGVAAVAWADDEAVAAVEAGHPFAIGLQWHPEDGDGTQLFEAFRDAATSHAAAA
jgi:putative glutamine amidotransferase